MPKISPLAVVEEGAVLADDVTVGPFSYVGPEVRVGPACVIDSNVVLAGRSTLAGRNHVFPMAVVGAAPGADDGEGWPLSGDCEIGEATVIREHATVYAGRRRPTHVGRDTLVMVGCHVGPGASVGDHVILANCAHIGARAVVEDYVRTSAFPVVQEGVRVGAYSFVAGYVRVDRDAPPYAMLTGSPYRVRGVNAHNLKQCGFGDDDIRALKQAFRELFNGQGGQGDPDVVQRLLADADTPQPVRRVAELYAASASRPEGDDG